MEFRTCPCCGAPGAAVVGPQGEIDACAKCNERAGRVLVYIQPADEVTEVSSLEELYCKSLDADESFDSDESLDRNLGFVGPDD